MILLYFQKKFLYKNNNPILFIENMIFLNSSLFLLIIVLIVNCDL